MKVLLDMPEKHLKELARIGETKGRSRAAIIREAIATYIALNSREQANDAFGLWGDRKVDGLEYQRKLRSEW